MSRRITAFGTDGLPVISQEHNLIHGGLFFSAGVSSVSLGAGTSLYIQIIVPAGVEVNLKAVNGYGSLATTYDLLEAPTITDGAVAVVALNRKRSSTRKSSLIMWSDPTAISAGVELEKSSFTGSAISNVGPQQVDTEWVLKPSTIYLLRLTNNGGANSTAFMKMFWYEERV